MQESENKYCILMEQIEEHYECIYYFIKYNGNEEAVSHLLKQLERVEWELYPDCDMNAFIFETQYLVSETTAKEMTKVDLNSQGFHRKFDGVLKMIDFGLRDPSKEETKKKREKVNNHNMKKINDMLRDGGIEEFIDNEDIDESDLETVSKSDLSSDETMSETNSSDNDKRVDNFPKVLQSSKPRFARKAQSHSYKNKLKNNL